MYKIGNFDVVKKLGEGNYGEVYLVVDSSTSINYAVKIMKINDSVSKTFTNQLDVVFDKKLSNSYLVKCYCNFIEDSRLFTIMEYCAKGNLINWLSKLTNPLGEEKVLEIFSQIIEGVFVLHCNNLIHSNIKPENILVDGKNQIKIADVGGGKQFDATMINCSIRTLGFVAPEIYDGKLQSRSADVFALGCVLYLLMTSTPPFHGATPFAIISRVAAHRFVSVEAGQYSRGLMKLMNAMMENDPKKRPSLAKVRTCKIVARARSKLPVCLPPPPAPRLFAFASFPSSGSSSSFSSSVSSSSIFASSYTSSFPLPPLPPPPPPPSPPSPPPAAHCADTSSTTRNPPLPLLPPPPPPPFSLTYVPSFAFSCLGDYPSFSSQLTSSTNSGNGSGSGDGDADESDDNYEDLDTDSDTDKTAGSASTSASSFIPASTASSMADAAKSSGGDGEGGGGGGGGGGGRNKNKNKKKSESGPKSIEMHTIVVTTEPQVQKHTDSDDTDTDTLTNADSEMERDATTASLSVSPSASSAYTTTSTSASASASASTVCVAVAATPPSYALSSRDVSSSHSAASASAVDEVNGEGDGHGCTDAEGCCGCGGCDLWGCCREKGFAFVMFVVAAVIYLTIGAGILVMAAVWKRSLYSPFGVLWVFLVVTAGTLLLIGLVSGACSCLCSDVPVLHAILIGVNFTMLIILLSMLIVVISFHNLQYPYINAVLKLSFIDLGMGEDADVLFMSGAGFAKTNVLCLVSLLLVAAALVPSVVGCCTHFSYTYAIMAILYAPQLLYSVNGVTIYVILRLLKHHVNSVFLQNMTHYAVFSGFIISALTIFVFAIAVVVFIRSWLSEYRERPGDMDIFARHYPLTGQQQQQQAVSGHFKADSPDWWVLVILWVTWGGLWVCGLFIPYIICVPEHRMNNPCLVYPETLQLSKCVENFGHSQSPSLSSLLSLSVFFSPSYSSLSPLPLSSSSSVSFTPFFLDEKKKTFRKLTTVREGKKKMKLKTEVSIETDADAEANNDDTETPGAGTTSARAEPFLDPDSGPDPEPEPEPIPEPQPRTDKDWNLDCARIGENAAAYSNATHRVGATDYTPCYDFRTDVEQWVREGEHGAWVIFVSAILLHHWPFMVAVGICSVYFLILGLFFVLGLLCCCEENAIYLTFPGLREKLGRDM